MFSFEIKENEAGAIKLNKQLSTLKLTPSSKKRIKRTLSKAVIKYTKQNISRQKTIDGKPMAKRKDKTNKRKLLLGLAKQLTVKHENIDVSYVTFKGLAANIAYAHHYGHKQTLSKSKLKRKLSNNYYIKPATRSMAKSLLKAGYKQAIPDKNGSKTLRRVSQSWITNNMTIGQAGLVLRKLRNKLPQTTWQVVLPPRPVLGLEEKNLNAVTQAISASLIKNAKRN